MFSKVLSRVYLGILAVHLIMVGLTAYGQIFPPAVRCAYPPLAPRPNGFSRAEWAGGGSSTQDLVRNIYISQIGVREKQPNAGPDVEKYLRYVNLPKGNPWCAAFVCWSLGEAKVENPRSGWSPALFGERYVISGKGGERGKVKVESDVPNAFSSNTMQIIRSVGRCACPPLAPVRMAQPGGGGGFCIHMALIPASGDVFGLYFPEKARIAHVGFVDEWNDPWVITVEGNTNVLGSREGDGVYRKRRLVRSIYKVARYII